MNTAKEILRAFLNKAFDDLTKEELEYIKPKIEKTLLRILTAEEDIEDIPFDVLVDMSKIDIKRAIKRFQILLNLVYSKGDVHSLFRVSKFMALAIDKILSLQSEAFEETKRREERVKRALILLSRVNEEILRSRSEKELIENICKIIVESGYLHAWMGYAREDGKVIPIAGFGSDYFKEIEVRWDESSLGRGPTGRAIREGRTIVMNRFSDNFKPWIEKARKKGFYSSASIPLKGLKASLNIYAGEEDAFDEEEIELLEKVAGNLSYAIQTLRTVKDRESLRKMFVEIVSRVPIIVTDGRKIIFVSEEFEKVFGYSSKDLIGKDFLEIIAEEEKKKIEEFRLLALTDKELIPKLIETVLVDSKGRKRYVFFSLSFLENQAIVYLADVTKLREEENKRKKLEKLYRAMLESSYDGVVVSDTSMRIIECNEAALNIIGLKREEIIGKNFIEIEVIYEEDLPEIIEDFAKALRGEVKKRELRIKRGKEIRWIDVTTTPIAEEGRVIGFLNVIRDITEKRKSLEEMEEKLLQLNFLHKIDLKILEGHNFEKISEMIAEELKKLMKADSVSIYVKDKLVFGEIDVESEKGVVNLSKIENLSERDKEIIRKGIRAYVVVPLRVKEEVIGKIALFFKTPKEIDTDFLEKISDQIAVSLHVANLRDERERMIERLNANIEQFAILVDKIRNPLAVARGFAECEIKDEELKKIFLEHLDKILDIVKKLDEGWLESEKIRRSLLHK